MKAPRRQHAATMWQQHSGDMVAMLAQQRGGRGEKTGGGGSSLSFRREESNSRIGS